MSNAKSGAGLYVIKARIRRWWYLLRVGSRKGEVAFDYYDGDGLIGMYSGRRNRASWLDESERIWWRR